MCIQDSECVPTYTSNLMIQPSTFQGCCYVCKKLTIRHVKLCSGGQKDCGNGNWPNATLNLTECYEIGVTKLDPTFPVSIFALCLATFGIILALACIIYGYVYR